MEKRVFIALVLILVVAWLGGCFDSKPSPPPRTYPIAGGREIPLDFSALTDSQQNEVIELVRRCNEIAELRSTQGKIRSLHLEFVLWRSLCLSEEHSGKYRELDMLLDSTKSLLDSGTKVIDLINPKLTFVEYTMAVEAVRAQHRDLVRACGTMVRMFLKYGCDDRPLQEKFREFGRSI